MGGITPLEQVSIKTKGRKFMKFEIVRGTTMTLLLTIKNEDESVYTLKDGEKLIFGVKLEPEKGDYVLKKIITSENMCGDGYIISIKPEDTQKLEFRDYRYDVGLQTADGDYYMVVPFSPFIVEKAVTQKE